MFGELQAFRECEQAEKGLEGKLAIQAAECQGARTSPKGDPRQRHGGQRCWGKSQDYDSWSNLRISGSRVETEEECFSRARPEVPENRCFHSSFIVPPRFHDFIFTFVFCSWEMNPKAKRTIRVGLKVVKGLSKVFFYLYLQQTGGCRVTEFKIH